MKDTIKSYLKGNEYAFAMTSMITVAIGLGLWLSQQPTETNSDDTALVLHCECAPL